MKNKADRTEVKAEAQPPPEEKGGVTTMVVTRLDELQTVCEKKIHVPVLLPSSSGGMVAMIPIRMLRPYESEKLELILKEAHPPLQDVRQPDGRIEKQYIPDAATLEKSAALRKEARSMALWWCCPLFAESEEGQTVAAKPAVEQRKAIHALVQSKFTEPILEKLYAVARAEEFQLDERVNFTIPPD